MLGVYAVNHGFAPKGFLYLFKKPGKVFLVSVASIYQLHFEGSLLYQFCQGAGLYAGLAPAQAVADCEVWGNALPARQHDGSPFIRCDWFLGGGHEEELSLLCYAPQIRSPAGGEKLPPGQSGFLPSRFKPVSGVL
jgi:hypothetical protein